MNTYTTVALSWWLHTLVGGGLLLLLGCLLLSLIRQPARRQRAGEWTMLAALLLAVASLAPAWLIVTVPWEHREEVPVATAPVAPAPAEPPRQPAAPAEAPAGELAVLIWPLPVEAPPPVQPAPEIIATPQPEPAVEAARVPTWETVLVWLAILHGCGAALLLLHWLVGHVALWRLVRSAEPASGSVFDLCDELRRGRPNPRLLVSPRVRVPFSFGLLRPTIVLPRWLCDRASVPVLRWVLAHELAHLERCDARSGWLFGLGQVCYYCFPWFWWLRRQVRLCQEYVADAAAVAAAGPAAEYAQFLLGCTTAAPVPAGAAGVFGHSSELFRRITMLLKSPVVVERKCPRSWSLFALGALLGLAVIVAGVGFRAEGAPAPEPAKKDDQKKDEIKKDQPKKEEAGKDEPKKAPDPFQQLDDLIKKGGFPMAPAQQFEEIQKQLQKQLEMIDKEHAKAMRQHLETMRKVLEAQKGLQGWGGLQGGFGILPGGQNNMNGRLGARVEKPTDTLVDQLDLPRNQGLIVGDIMPESAAAKAGLKSHDILLEVNGKPVSSNVAEFVKQLNDVKANTPVNAVVMRKGKKETVKGLSLPEAKADVPGFPANPFQFPVVPFGNLQPGAFPNLPGIQIQLQGQPGAPGVSTSISRTNDDFTATRQEGDLKIDVTGKVVEGKPVPSEIKIQDGKESHKAETLEKVPEKYCETVKRLLDSVSGKNGGVELRKKNPEQ
jgi:beta-lactamase regulating signal transducer with metallopeptidase domain